MNPQKVVASGGGKAFPTPRPLYNLDKLAERPDDWILVVEGEKTADAAAELFPDHVAMTSPGGAKAAAKPTGRR